MQQKIELLAPGGDLESIKAAIAAGADAVYCGLDRFNARNRAENLSLVDLHGVVRLAHANDCEVFLTLNIIILESEIPTLTDLLNRLVNTGIDGVIVQDFGLLHLLAVSFPSLAVHGSTQLTTHNEGQVQFLSHLNLSRVNLSRELNLSEIRALTEVAHKREMLTEVFVHGSSCIAFSGLCYFSSVHGGNSGNRGRCSQPCRGRYLPTTVGVDFPLNMKDNSAYSDLAQLAATGVDSLKIEGRIKKFHYVYTVVRAWRRQLQRLFARQPLRREKDELRQVFNRDFTSGYLRGALDKDMFVDNPRDNSAVHLAKSKGGDSEENIEVAKSDLYDLRTEIITEVKEKIASLSTAREDLQITVFGEAGDPLKVTIHASTEVSTFFSEEVLVPGDDGGGSLDREMLLDCFSLLYKMTGYGIGSLNWCLAENSLFLPRKELISLVKSVVASLNGNERVVPHVTVSFLKRQRQKGIRPHLSLLISTEEDLYLCGRASGNSYFQLPDSLGEECARYVELFRENRGLVPWFPPILIGEDYHTAVDFLLRLRPERIVTNNSGIAWQADLAGIPWVAGPFMNIANSLSMICLQQRFHCRGAFLSSELSRVQIKTIAKPDDFALYYTLFHPVLLMSSRQCLYQQVSGCGKKGIDDDCIRECARTAEIRTLNKGSLLLRKSRGEHNTLYDEYHCLNTDVVAEVPDLFSSFLVDLRGIGTNTNVSLNSLELLRLFEKMVAGDPHAPGKIHHAVFPTINTQYRKGM